ncbi:hypothetical protein BD560DRAFT_337190, partial [Blakeslea trispora]
LFSDSLQNRLDMKQRRRESHNAVEKRRRSNINDRIYELSTLLPKTETMKSSKNTILKQSVDHIKSLHEKLLQYQKRTKHLEQLLETYRMHQDKEEFDSPLILNHPKQYQCGSRINKV